MLKVGPISAPRQAGWFRKEYDFRRASFDIQLLKVKSFVRFLLFMEIYGFIVLVLWGA